jgi:thiosulfate reductase cytochrome b subunit
MIEESKRRPAQPWAIRLTHWANVPLLAILAMSGLQIWLAYPYLGPRGDLIEAFPLQGWTPRPALTIGGWLAGGRHWHFAFMWFFVLNALVYGVYVLASGEWRRRLFNPRRDSVGALQMAAYYLRLRREPPPQGLYNPLQRLGYTSALAFGALGVWSGAVMYKPVQWQWLGVPLGGYEGARIVHSASLFLLFAFTVAHLVMVFLHPRHVRAMFTGREKP